jgi:hypothetical protein
LRFLEREGLVHGLPEPPDGDAAPSDDLLYAIVAELVPPAAMAELLAARLHLPLLETGSDVDVAAAALLSPAVATRCGVAPVSLQGDTLEVATANPLDLDTVKTVEFATGRRVRLRVTMPETLRRILGRLYGGEEAAPAVEPDAPGVEPDAPAVEPEAPAVETARCAPHVPRILVLMGDAAARDRFARGLHQMAPDWLVMTAQDASEARMLATITCPDVAVAESAAIAESVGGDVTPAVPWVVAPDPNGVQDVIAQIRTIIDRSNT